MRPKRRRLVRVEILPTLLTLGSLICGFWALTSIIKGEFLYAAWLILVAMGVFDALDGKIARLTRSASSFGTQLDSLSDIVSFGVAPAFLAYQMINQSNYHIISSKFTFLLCAFYLVCAALRLARFNAETSTDPSAHQYFSGLPSPGAAGMIATVVILHYELLHREGIRIILTLLPFLTLGLALLMVSRFRYIHLLNRLTKTNHPFIRLVEIILVGLLVAFQPEITLCAGFMIYVLSGLVLYLRAFFFPRTRVALMPRESIAVNDKKTASAT